MPITAELLLSLGFFPLLGRPGRFSYKGFSGQLLESGIYTFLGFNPPITTLADLRYMLMLIDYQEQSGFEGIPTTKNSAGDLYRKRPALIFMVG